MAKPTQVPALAASRVLCDLQVLGHNIDNLAELMAPEGFWNHVAKRPEMFAALRNEIDSKIKELKLIHDQLDAALDRLGTLRAPQPK